MDRGRRGLLFVVAGPSGVGKTTVCRKMLKIFPDLRFSVSYTTRPPRPGDQEGRDYFFVSPEAFQAMVDRQEFVEWAEIYGFHYGTARKKLEEAREQGWDVILDIDGQGARQLREKKIPAIFIFILPPSLAALQERLERRKTEIAAAAAERLQKARREMAEARHFDYWILNDDLETAQEKMRSIILAEHCRRERVMRDYGEITRFPDE